MSSTKQQPNHQPNTIRPECEELRRLLQSYAETYHPQNEAEHTLVRQLALATIRLRRLEPMEEQLWQQNEPCLNQIAQCERLRASAERTFHRNYHALETLRKARSKSNPKPQPAATARREPAPEPITQIKPEPAPKRDLQAELDAITGRPLSLAEIDTLLGSRSPLESGPKEGPR